MPKLTLGGVSPSDGKPTPKIFTWVPPLAAPNPGLTLLMKSAVAWATVIESVVLLPPTLAATVAVPVSEPA